MKNNKKKGFTLVELVVVMAIIAILSTVAVVGYSTFIDKANQSNADVAIQNVSQTIELEFAGTEEVVAIGADTAVVYLKETADGYAVYTDEAAQTAATADQLAAALEAHEAFEEIADQGDFSLNSDKELVYNNGASATWESVVFTVA